MEKLKISQEVYKNGHTAFILHSFVLQYNMHFHYTILLLQFYNAYIGIYYIGLYMAKNFSIINNNCLQFIYFPLSNIDIIKLRCKKLLPTICVLKKKLISSNIIHIFIPSSHSHQNHKVLKFSIFIIQ